MKPQDCEFKTMNVIGADWNSVKTVNDLFDRIILTCDILDDFGHFELANRWRNRSKNAPLKMDKDAINYVLVLVSGELKNFFYELENN